MLPTIHRVRFPKKPTPTVQPQATIDLREVYSAMNEMQTFKKTFEKKYVDLLEQSRTELERQKTTMARGIRGPQGDRGEKGETIVGPQGLRGEAGYTPVKGKDYFDGKDGKNGKNADDAGITKKVLTQVTAQINLVKTSLFDELKKKLLEIITKEFETMRGDIRHISSKMMLGGGGGGMGTIKYFKFTCDGGTTAFTLPDIPTQEGNAVFAFYQGSRLHPDDHYTVSGRTLNATFTGETGTFIDGWIIT